MHLIEVCCTSKGMKERCVLAASTNDRICIQFHVAKCVYYRDNKATM